MRPARGDRDATFVEPQAAFAARPELIPIAAVRLGLHGVNHGDAVSEWGGKVYLEGLTHEVSVQRTFPLEPLPGDRIRALARVDAGVDGAEVLPPRAERVRWGQVDLII